MTVFHYFDLAEAHQARGVIVAIDVLRAFTTAAYAFQAGVNRIYPVASVNEALALKAQLKEALTMGEVDGYQPESFDFGNSPAQIRRVDVQGKVLVHRSSAGTQGLTRAAKASPGSPLLAASFVIARATASYLQALNPETVSFIVTGAYRGRDGDEDRACGEYIEALMKGDDPDPQVFTHRVATSTVGRSFMEGEAAFILQEDYLLSIKANEFPFCMPVRQDGDFLVMEKHFI